MTQRYLLRHSPFTSSDKTSSLPLSIRCSLSCAQRVVSLDVRARSCHTIEVRSQPGFSFLPLSTRRVEPQSLFILSLLAILPFFLLLSGKMSQARDIVVFNFLSSSLWQISMPLQSFLSAIQNNDSQRTALCPQPLRCADRLDYAEISCTREERLSLPLTILSAADVQHC